MKYLRLMLMISLMTMPLWAASRLGIYTSLAAQVPFEFAVGRSSKQHIHAGGIGAEAGHVVARTGGVR